MQLLSRLGAAPLAIKNLVNQSACLKLLSVSCSLNKLHSFPKRHDVLNEERVLDPKTKVIYVWRENSSGWYVVKTWKDYDVKMSVRAKGDIKHGGTHLQDSEGSEGFYHRIVRC
ncbi:unnamed protein product [Lymnaea stagnalis]|uniref:Uncharacterized protein n=1 Tax=Lymnaea stagnalis TaxID=6523 RepID=A0AAV2HIA8_LYMST